MENRSIKELLQVMLGNKQYFETGLCYWSWKLYYYDIINSVEAIQLEYYFQQNQLKNNGYWWVKGDIKPRIEWLEEHIKINS